MFFCLDLIQVSGWVLISGNFPLLSWSQKGHRICVDLMQPWSSVPPPACQWHKSQPPPAPSPRSDCSRESKRQNHPDEIVDKRARATKCTLPPFPLSPGMLLPVEDPIHHNDIYVSFQNMLPQVLFWRSFDIRVVITRRDYIKNICSPFMVQFFYGLSICQL